MLKEMQEADAEIAEKLGELEEKRKRGGKAIDDCTWACNALWARVGTPRKRCTRIWMAQSRRFSSGLEKPRGTPSSPAVTCSWLLCLLQATGKGRLRDCTVSFCC